MKLGNIVDPMFLKSLGAVLSMEIPKSVAWQLKGTYNKVQTEVKKYDELRTEMLKKYGKKDEKGELVTGKDSQVEFEPESLDKFANELRELQNVEVELKTVKLSELGDVKLTAKDLIILDGLIVE